MIAGEAPPRICVTCEEPYPASATFFYRVDWRSDGLDPRCKACRQPGFTKTWEQKLLLIEGKKRCKGCGEIYPATTRFFRSAGGSQAVGGVEGHCRACKAHPDNREMMLLKMLCPEGSKPCSLCRKIKPAGTQHFYANPTVKDGLMAKCAECVRAQLRSAGSEARAKDRERSRAWRRRNRTAQTLQTQTRRARQRGIITAEQWAAMLDFYEGRCLCCGSCERITLDHVVPIAPPQCGPNLIGNAQPLCSACNSRKYTTVADHRDPYLHDLFMEALAWQGIL